MKNKQLSRWAVIYQNEFRLQMNCNLLVCILLVFQYALIAVMKSEDCGKITND